MHLKGTCNNRCIFVCEYAHNTNIEIFNYSLIFANIKHYVLISNRYIDADSTVYTLCPGKNVPLYFLP